MFVDYNEASISSWQSFERLVKRVLIVAEYDDVRIVGQAGDKGADIIAHKFNKRWLFQVKCWNVSVGMKAIDRTLEAASTYDAEIPVIVSLNGFDNSAREHQRKLMTRGINLQLWDISQLKRIAMIGENVVPNKYSPRSYQEEAIKEICYAFFCDKRSAMIVLATGLGKTFVAGEAARRILSSERKRFLVLAHTNELVYQLEREFWKFMRKEDRSIVWNGKEKPIERQLEEYEFVFACIDSVFNYIDNGKELPNFDIVITDECHHCGSKMYTTLFENLECGTLGGPFLIGMTATPWRSDEVELEQYFGKPLITVDMVYGMKHGYLANVDYRIYTDNIDWDGLNKLSGNSFSPKQINRTLFINQWDDSVVVELQNTWKEQYKPRAIVFCGTIEHADTMKRKLNQLGFCKAEALYSQNDKGFSMTQFERNLILSNFSEGKINVLCVVDIFNEGIDVPDVNIIVFQRVTHSRRIFIQQLGRGLRLADDKEKVIVLDFVSDIRRFAAGIELKDELNGSNPATVRINLPGNNRVTFRKVLGEDERTEKFLREWLEDIARIEELGENDVGLKFPPTSIYSGR
jgi:superfamily II DNA or RNA helicase